MSFPHIFINKKFRLLQVDIDTQHIKIKALQNF